MKNNRTVTASAPGKLLLMGDHAVVYGYPCIVTAVNERMYATVSAIDTSDLLIGAPGVDISGYKKPLSDLGTDDIPKGARFIEHAVKNFVEKYPITAGGISVSTRADFSSEVGFGSSSAIVVSVLWALSALFEKNIDAHALFDLSFKTVLDVQGVGSGFDVASAIFGGTIYYSRLGQIIEPIAISEIPLVVGYTGVKADTTMMVQSVAAKQKQSPQKVNRIFSAISQLVDDAKKKMEEGDWERVGKLMEFNQEYLRDLGVSSEKLESLIKAAIDAGAYGAKLSGAGGGDCMISLIDPSVRDAAETAVTNAGGTVIAVQSGAQGVRIDLPASPARAGQTGTTDNQEELLIVVNDQDEIVEYKSRKDCHSNPSLLHRTVGVVLFNDKGNILLQKRSMTKDMDAGLWGISAAGHVNKGQTDDDAAHRELLEELGIDTELEFVDAIIIRNAQESERAALYKGVYSGEIALNENEVERVEWVNIAAIPIMVNSGTLQLTDAATQALRKMGVSI